MSAREAVGLASAETVCPYPPGESIVLSACETLIVAVGSFALLRWRRSECKQGLQRTGRKPWHVAIESHHHSPVVIVANTVSCSRRGNFGPTTSTPSRLRVSLLLYSSVACWQSWPEPPAGRRAPTMAMLCHVCHRCSSGIPTLLPGEAITHKALDILEAVKAGGGVISGCTDPSLTTMRVIDSPALDA